MKDQEQPAISNIRKYVLWVVSLATLIIAVIVWLLRVRRRQKSETTARRQPPTAFLPGVGGLSEQEATSRLQEGQDNGIYLRPRRTTRQLWAENAYSIFNLSLIGLALLQALFGRPLDALISLGVLLLNISLNIFQEKFSQFRIRETLQEASPNATVVRDGKPRSIDINLVVPGDVLAIGPGDQLPVDGLIIGDGQVLVDETILFEHDEYRIKNEGDEVYAGSIAIGGMGLCEVQRVGKDRRIAGMIQELQTTREALTPIQAIIDRVLRILLLIVALYSILLVVNYFQADITLQISDVDITQVLVDTSSVIFSIAPAGLFFMIILTYASSAVDLVKIGALVRRASAVESLAGVDVMCFVRGGVLTGTGIDIIPIDYKKGEEPISNTRLHQILGDFAHSITLDTPEIRAMDSYLDGNRRLVVDEVTFFSLLGWSAVAVEDHDLRGVYVLGKPELLRPFLIAGSNSDEEQDERPSDIGGNFLKRISGIFRRSKNGDESNENALSTGIDEPQSDVQGISRVEGTDTAEDSADPGRKPGLFARVVNGIRQRVQRSTPGDQENDAGDSVEPATVELLFAYKPIPEALYDDNNTPRLPEGLEPLCHLRFSEKILPQAIETLEYFRHDGVDVKIVTPDNTQQTVDLLAAAGFPGESGESVAGTSAHEFANASAEDMSRIVEKNTVFGDLNLAQAAQLVRSLRRNGHHVAVVGDRAADMLALRQANLPIAMQTGSQAIINLADIILLEGAPKALQNVLVKGQRIVNGLLDILKLYLSQVFSLVLLIMGVRLFSFGFPYKSIHGSVIVALTVTVPSLALALWDKPGIVHSARLRRMLVRFTVPASITSAMAALLVYIYFLNTYQLVSYAQIAVTYSLVAIGLILVLFIHPPEHGWRSGLGIVREPRIIFFVILGAVAFVLAVAFPFIRDLLHLELLRSTQDYLLIAIVTVIWAITLQVIWRLWQEPMK